MLGVVCTAVAFVFLFALIGEVGAPRAQVITYINPAVALLLGVLVLGEPLTLGIAIGFLFLITRRRGRSDASAGSDPGT